MEDKTPSFSLKEIALWQLYKSSNSNEIRIDTPSLQRGLVWDPAQIEMFWDSLMRGFPFGSIVIARPLQNQIRQNDGPAPDYHLLDGQQRCNAITWGFVVANIPEAKEQMLWLDLLPGDRLKNSTRKYLFRVTTRAHPWGFGRDDAGSTLGVCDRLEFLDRWRELHDDCSSENASCGDQAIRPLPNKCVPKDSVLPVPVADLIECFNKDGGHIDWDELARRPMVEQAQRWKNMAVKSLAEDQRRFVERGLKQALDTRVIALCVPDSVHEVDEIEQVFVRLNRQGTTLDPEELAYSMIKAYWPEIEVTMTEITKSKLRHTGDARLINMGMRTALTLNEQKREQLRPALSIERIRKIFGRSQAGADNSQVQATKEDDVLHEKLTRYFYKEDKKPPITQALHWIDRNFLYTNDRPYGIPAYLRSSLAWSSPAVFSWLMYLADSFGLEDLSDATTAKRILGLALAIHWFGEDKDRAVNVLVKEGYKIPLQRIVDLDGRKTYLTPLQTPERVAEAIHLSHQLNDQDLANWGNMWQGVVNLPESNKSLAQEHDNSRLYNVGVFVNKLCNQKELLLYAQRRYIEGRFNRFDPSYRRMFRGHNRPWDYDHILASATLDGRRGSAGPYHRVCKTWQETIGNMIAIDFSSNRSYGTIEASVKGEDNAYKEVGDECFLILDKAANPHVETKCGLPKTEDFQLTLEQTAQPEAARRFVGACQRRLVALYGSWYHTLNVDTYLELGTSKTDTQ